MNNAPKNAGRDRVEDEAEVDAQIIAANAALADGISASLGNEGMHPVVALRRSQVAAEIHAAMQRIWETEGSVDGGKQDKAA